MHSFPDSRSEPFFPQQPPKVPQPLITRFYVLLLVFSQEMPFRAIYRSEKLRSTRPRRIYGTSLYLPRLSRHHPSIRKTVPRPFGVSGSACSFRDRVPSVASAESLAAGGIGPRRPV